jgi:hypothetical protein
MNLYESALKRGEVLNDIAKDLSVLERDIAAARTSKAALVRIWLVADIRARPHKARSSLESRAIELAFS